MTSRERFIKAHSLTRETISRFGGDYRVTFAAALAQTYEKEDVMRKTYSNGDVLEVKFIKNGRDVVITMNGKENCALGIINKLNKPVVKDGETYTRIIGGKWALTEAEYGQIRDMGSKALECALKYQGAFDKLASSKPVYDTMTLNGRSC